MTKEQKSAYKDCIIYLVQYAQKCEESPVMRIFCLDIVRKARLLYNFKPHLFYDTDINEHLRINEEKYTNNPLFHRDGKTNINPD